MLLAVDWRHYSRKSPREIGQPSCRAGASSTAASSAGCSWPSGLRGDHELPLWPTADVLAPGVVIGQSIGRLGCFAAGCCWGKTATVPWAITFTDIEVARTIGTPLDTPVHPSQIYESLLTLLIFVVLIWLAPARSSRARWPSTYVVLYSIARFGLEFFRGDAERGFLGPLSTSQWVAIVLLLLAAALFLRLRKLRVATPAPRRASGSTAWKTSPAGSWWTRGSGPQARRLAGRSGARDVAGAHPGPDRGGPRRRRRQGLTLLGPRAPGTAGAARRARARTRGARAGGHPPDHHPRRR